MIAPFILLTSASPDAAMMPSRFDLSEVRSHVRLSARPSDRSRRYRLSGTGKGLWYGDGGDDDGIQVKWHWNRVKLKVPIPSI